MAFQPATIEDHGRGKAILHVTQKCGHRTRLSYGGKEFAESDMRAQEAIDCVHCQNAAFVKQSQNARSDNNAK
jgi:hypothetical protein